MTPSNVDQGYVLRRLIRRAVRHGMKLGMPEGFTCQIAQVIIDQYKDNYPELERNGAHILEQLKGMNKLFRIRVPLIPTVNDTEENMEATARLLEGAAMLEKVELLRYNRAAGAKYDGLSMRYAPQFDPEREPNVYTAPFEELNMEVMVR